ncbi:hypothetical protein EVAR_96922_1, partial [Eumeta japonica]
IAHRPGGHGCTFKDARDKSYKNDDGIRTRIKWTWRAEFNIVISPLLQRDRSFAFYATVKDASQAERLGRSCLSNVPRFRLARLGRNATMSHAFRAAGVHRFIRRYHVKNSGGDSGSQGRYSCPQTSRTREAVGVGRCHRIGPAGLSSKRLDLKQEEGTYASAGRS